MTRARFIDGLLSASLLFTGHASAETAAPNAQHLAESAPSDGGGAEERVTTLSASAYAFFLPDKNDYLQPTVSADRASLHLEGRYNYEDSSTGSAWVGYNFSGGGELAWELTPMLGGVFGNTSGLAPGYEGALGFGKLELYSEGEYILDFGDASAGFFYNWSELTLSPLEWFRFGVVVQRTRVYRTDRDIQRGLLVGFSNGLAGFTTYVLNPDDSAPVWVIALDLDVEL